MKTCSVCHKFIKQPKYCPKHEPQGDVNEFMRRLLNQPPQQQTLNMQPRN